MIDIRFPKQWVKLGYDPNKPQRDRRQAISRIARADPNFPTTFRNIINLKGQQTPFHKCNRRMKKDMIFYKVFINKKGVKR